MNKTGKIGFIAFAAVIALTMTALSLTGCIVNIEPTQPTQPPEKDGKDNTGVIPLTPNTWANGNIAVSGGEEWFCFTATATTQYIHFDPVTFIRVNIQVYESDGTTTVGGLKQLDRNSANCASQTLTNGSVYYIKVVSNSNRGGAYRIAFNTSDTAPNTQSRAE